MRTDAPTLYLTGASGFIGDAVIHAFLHRGWSIYAQSRTPEKWHSSQALQWCSGPETVDRPIDLLINLAGKSLATRWSDSAKESIYASRIDFTERLIEAFQQRPELAPGFVFNASAVGYYAPGDAARVEDSPAGPGFASRLCKDWEGAARGFADLGSRVHALRFGVVLDPQGGALASMLPAFRLGMGASLGSGHQWFSWISREDLVRAMLYLYSRAEELPPAINLVAPGALPQRDFAKKLGRALSRPVFMRAPTSLLRLALGEGADDFLLANLRVEPKVLEELEFDFHHPDLDAAFSYFFNAPD